MVVLARFRLNEAGSSAMVIAKVSPSFTVAVCLRFAGPKKRVFRVRSDECYWKTDEC